MTGDQSLMEQLAHWLRRTHLTKVKEHLVPETRVEKMQHRVLAAANVQINPARVTRGCVIRSWRGNRRCTSTGLPGTRRALLSRQHPIPLRCRIHKRLRIFRRAVAQVVPATSRPTWHGVGLAHHGGVSWQERRIDTRRTSRRVRPITRLCKRWLWRTTFDRSIVSEWRQCHRQRSHRNRIVISFSVVDHWERFAPIALPTEQPIAQAIIDTQSTDALRFKPRNCSTFRFGGRHAVHRKSTRRVRAIDRTPFAAGGHLAGPSHARDVDNLQHRQRKLLGKFKVTLIVRRHRHDRTGSVAHEHIVRGPDGNVLAGRWIDCKQASWNAGLLL